jgi:ABC-type Na+ efflux pump permease subunit
MRKVIVVALREYNAAVRTWAFVIGLAMMPILMGGSFAAQWLFKDDADTRARTVGVVDLTPGQKLFRGLEAAFQAIPDSTSTL